MQMIKKSMICLGVMMCSLILGACAANIVEHPQLSDDCLEADGKQEETKKVLEQDSRGQNIYDGFGEMEAAFGIDEFTATMSNNDLVIELYATGAKGKLQGVFTKCYIQYTEEEKDDYKEQLNVYKEVITELQAEGRDILITSDDQERTMFIMETNSFGEGGPYELGLVLSMIGITSDDILDENQVPDISELEFFLGILGFQIEKGKSLS